MRKARILAIVVAVLLRGVSLHGAAPMDRAALLAALQQRADTGAPRHLDHDAGEELQSALNLALSANPNDLEIAWAAAKAAVALVPQVNPPITDGSHPAAWIEVYPSLALPWRQAAEGTIEISLDGSGWRHGADLPRGAMNTPIPIDRIFGRASNRPGFHVLRFRALLRYSGLPGALPNSETRDLPARTYGVTGASAAGRQAAAILTSAARASAYSLDRALPEAAVADWLRSQMPHTAAPPDVVWTSRWCETRTEFDEPSSSSVCALAMIASPLGGHAEMWIKVASVDTSGAKPVWNAETPSLEGVDLLQLPTRSTVSPAALPFALQKPEESWPRMSVAIDAADIEVTPARPRPREPVHVRVTVRNTGDAPVYGMSLDILAFDTPERVLLRRRFIRSIPAGESIVLEADSVFPLGYGGVMVSAIPLSEHTVLGMPMAQGDSTGFSHAARLIRLDLAPRGYTNAVRASVGCTADCRNVR